MKTKSKASSKVRKLTVKPLHIMVEGADGLGKSTVCKLLSKRLKLPIIKMADMPKYFKDGRQEEASEVFNKTVSQFAEFSFIMDRGYLSSLVYSKVYDRTYDFSYIGDIEPQDPFIVLLTGATPFRPDEIIDSGKWNRLNELYRKIVAAGLKEGRPGLILDVQNLHAVEICDIIVRKIYE